MGTIIKCAKCADIIDSKYTHDFKRCKCGAIAIDGGNDYTHMTGASEDILMLKDGEWQCLQDLRTNWN